QIKWQNNTSGHLNAELQAGIGVQGQLLLHQGKLFLAGGAYVSPGIFDAATGKCLNPAPTKYGMGKNPRANAYGARGWRFVPEGDGVKDKAGIPFYAFESPTEYGGGPILNPRPTIGAATGRGCTVVVQRDGQVLCYQGKD